VWRTAVASGSAKSISVQMQPIGNDMQQASWAIVSARAKPAERAL
jgi:hypothetical protein